MVNVGREDTESDGVNEDEDIVELMTSGITCKQGKSEEYIYKTAEFSDTMHGP